VYFQWIREAPAERLTFVEARANKTAILQYKGEHDDLPPGINFSEAQSVGFRRA